MDTCVLNALDTCVLNALEACEQLDTCVMHTQAVILSEDDWNLVTNGRTLLNDEGEITPAAFEVMMLHQVLCGAVCCECVFHCFSRLWHSRGQRAGNALNPVLVPALC